MKQQISQQQKQIQTTFLTPRMQQALKLLQVPALELRSLILSELETNPVLEESLESPLEEVGQDQTTETLVESATATEETEFASSFLESREPYTVEQAKSREYFLESISVQSNSLLEYVMAQANCNTSDKKLLEALEYLLGHLDSSGFLTAPVESFAKGDACPFSAELLQEALQALKTLEPIGLGAANTQECLLLQLETQGRKRDIAYTIVEKHYDLLLKRKVPALAKCLNTHPTEIEAAIAVIKTLDPHPGKFFSEDTNRVIIPDIRLERGKEQGWIVILNNENIPQLRLSSTYQKLLKDGKLTPEEREYLNSKMRAGKFIIQAIEGRQTTLKRLAEAIVVLQKAFFEKGLSALKPLTMKEVAEVLDLHETTVSRAIANKFIDTPFGVYPLKFFFVSGLRNEAGEEKTGAAVQQAIASLIKNEPVGKPYSDQKIVALLEEKNIKVARRTVAKYREALKLPPAHLRKSFDL